MQDSAFKRAILQALLFTDGCVMPERHRVSFASTSDVLVERFVRLVRDVYGYTISKGYIQSGKAGRLPVTVVQFPSKEIVNDLLSDTPGYRTDPRKDGTYPDARVPKSWYALNDAQLVEVLRSAFDCDGGCSLRISESRKKDCYELERSVFLACWHPVLRKQYAELVNMLGITAAAHKDRVSLSSEENFKKFKDIINFSPNVNITFKSRWWQGIEKRKLLDLILHTYSFSYGYLQQFDGKTAIYSDLQIRLRGLP